MIELTTTFLLQACEEAVARFHQMREEDRSPDFFAEVKPYADHMRDVLKQWQQQSYAWIEENHPKYMHKQQIDHAIDAMEQFFVQSFYKETSKKRFLQSVQSTQYTLSTLLRYVEEGGHV